MVSRMHRHGGVVLRAALGLWLAASGGCAGLPWRQAATPPGRLQTPDKLIRPSMAARQDVAPARRVVQAAYREVEPLETPPSQPADQPPDVEQMQSVEQVLSYTLEHHPMLRARRHEVDVARGSLVTAGLWPNPQLVLDTDNDTSGLDRQTSISGRVDFTLQVGQKRQRSLAVAHAAICKAQHALDVETLAIVTEASEAALQVLYLQELDELQRQVSELAAGAADVQRGKSKSGVISDVDSLVAEVDAADIEFARLKKDSDLELARMRLAKAMGVNPPRPVRMAGRLDTKSAPPLPLESVLAAARRSRPEIMEAEATVEQSRRQLALARAKAIPDVKVGPRWQDRLGTGNGDTAGARLAFDVPVFAANQGNILAGIAQVRANRAALEATEISTLSDVAAVYQQLRPVETSLQFFERQVLPLSVRAEQALRAAEASRTIDPFQTSNNLQRLSRMKLSHLELRYLHAQLRLRLELFLGQKLEDLGSAETVLTPAAEPAAEPAVKSQPKRLEQPQPKPIEKPQPQRVEPPQPKRAEDLPLPRDEQPPKAPKAEVTPRRKTPPAEPPPEKTDSEPDLRALPADESETPKEPPDLPRDDSKRGNPFEDDPTSDGPATDKSSRSSPSGGQPQSSWSPRTPRFTGARSKSSSDGPLLHVDSLR